MLKFIVIETWSFHIIPHCDSKLLSCSTFSNKKTKIENFAGTQFNLFQSTALDKFSDLWSFVNSQNIFSSFNISILSTYGISAPNIHGYDRGYITPIPIHNRLQIIINTYILMPWSRGRIIIFYLWGNRFNETLNLTIDINVNCVK